MLVARFETRLRSRDFIFEVEDAPGAANQTELLLHCFAHGCECEAVGTSAISGQWTSVGRAEAKFCAGCQLGEESGETLTLPLPQALDLKPSRTGGEGRNRPFFAVFAR